VQEHCPPEKPLPFASRRLVPFNQSPIASRHSLIAVCHLPFAIRQSPVANRYRFGSAGASPSRFLAPRPASIVPLSRTIACSRTSLTRRVSARVISANSVSAWVIQAGTVKAIVVGAFLVDAIAVALECRHTFDMNGAKVAGSHGTNPTQCCSCPKQHPKSSQQFASLHH